MSWGLGSKFKEKKKGLNVSESVKKQRKKTHEHTVERRQDELETGPKERKKSRLWTDKSRFKSEIVIHEVSDT